MDEISEKEYISLFLKKLDLFEKVFETKNIRLYAVEFPVKTPDGEKYEDVILESVEQGNIVTNNKNNILYCMEFKIDKLVDYHSATAQNLRLVDYISKQLYRPNVQGIIVAQGFSESEIKLAEQHNMHLIQFIPSDFMKKIS